MWLVLLLMRYMRPCARRHAALEDRAGVCVGGLDIELFGVHVEVALGVCSRALQNLDEELGKGLRRVLKDGFRFLNIFAADEAADD